MSTRMDDVPEQRRRMMSKIRSKDTKPELVVRRLLHSLGYRYRLHRPDLPGRPDIVFPSRRQVIEVRGCFWHGHTGCKNASLPRTRRAWWEAKLLANSERDRRNLTALEQLGWRVLVLWECQLDDAAELEVRLRGFLDGLDLVSKPYDQGDSGEVVCEPR